MQRVRYPHRALLVVALIATSFITRSHADQPVGIWVQKAPLPVARLGSPAGVIDGKLYVASGCCTNFLSSFPPRINRLDIYDPVSDTWSQGMAQPHGVYSAASGVLNGKLYIAGGAAGGNGEFFQNIADLQIYNPATNTWSFGASLPQATAAAASAVLDGQLYVAGGMDAPNLQPVGTLRVYNPATNSWSFRASMPTPRSWPAAGAINGKLYVVGGGDMAHLYGNLNMYDPATGLWSTLAPMPTPRYGHTVEVIGGVLYAIGGFDNVNYLDTVEAYDPATNTWTPMPPMPEAHYVPQTGVIDDVLHVVGGQSTHDNPSATHHAIVFAKTDSEMTVAGAAPYQGPGTLTATLTAAGHPISNAIVSFAIDGNPVGQAATNSSGVAKLNGIDLGGRPAGTYPNAVTASFAGTGGFNASDASGDLTVDQADPGLTWDTPSPITWPAALTTSQLNATANVSGTFAYSPDFGAVLSPGIHALSVTFTPDDSQSFGTKSASVLLVVQQATPTINASGGMFDYDGNPHAASVTVTHNGNTVQGTTNVFYSPNVLAPQNAGSYGVNVVFTSTDPNLANATQFFPSLININPVAPVSVTATGGTFTYDHQQHAASGTARGLFNEIIQGFFSYVYTPGGFTPPLTVGTYAADGTFQSNNPNYTSGATVSTTIVIEPSTPSLFVPPDMTLEAQSFSGRPVQFQVSGSDADGPLTPQCTYQSGTVFPLGTTTVSCTVDGPNSSPLTKSFHITIQDTIRPVITPAANLFVQATGTSGAVVTYAPPSVFDIADPHPNVVLSPPSGSLFPHGSSSVQVTATDASGNFAMTTFSVNVSPKLLSVQVAPSSASAQVGQSRFFSARGVYSDSPTPRNISPGAPSGPNNGLNGATWNIAFSPILGITVCDPTVPGYTNQGFFTNTSGQISEVWSKFTPNVNVTGTQTLSQVSLTLTCTNGAGSPVSILANWTGTRYEADFTDFGGATVHATITGWSSKAPMPTARWGMGAAAVNVDGQDRIYTFGGGANTNIYNVVEAYTPATNTWATIDAPMPFAESGAGVAAFDGHVYVVGGLLAGGMTTGVVQVFRPATGTWTTGLPAMPTPRGYFSLVEAGGKLYAIGGVIVDAQGNRSVTGVVERFDPAQPALGWTSLAPMPTPRHFTAAGALNNGSLIAVVGGQTVNGPAMSVNQLYNVDSDSWTQGTSLLAPSTGAAAAVVNNALFLFGGHNQFPLQLHEMYRPATSSQPDGWAGMALLPTARLQHSAVVVGDVIYAMGGMTGGPNPTPALGTVEAYSTPPDVTQFVLSRDPFQGGGGGSGVTWSLSSAGVATINNFGNAMAVAAGEVTVIAESQGVSCVTTNTCAKLTVTVPPINLGLPNQATAQQGDDGRWGCGSFFDPNPAGGQWQGKVTWGDEQPGTPASTLTLLIPPSGDCAPSGGGSTPTGVFSFNHAYANTGAYTVTVTVTNTVSGATRTQSFTVNVEEGGDDGCSEVSSNISKIGNVPLTSVHITLYERTSGEELFQADLPFGPFVLGEAPEGSFRIVFSVPAGYIVTPSQIDFDPVCGTPVVLAAQVRVADTTPPVLSLPGPITREATSANGAAVTFTSTATDNVDGAVNVICSPASGSTFPLGTTQVSCEATDAAGNKSQGGFPVSVVDTTAPSISSITPDQTSLWPPNHKMVPVTLAVASSDAVDAAPVCSITGVSSNQGGNENWQFAPGSLTVNLRAEKANGGMRTYTVTVTCRDLSGNASTGTAVVKVPKSQGQN